jgi:hypothetical protein
MPTIPVLGQPRKVMIQPPHSQVTEIPPDSMQVTPIPEPAIKVEDIPIKSQEQLASESILQQTVAKRNTMTPNAEPAPAYQFTDSDRQKAIESRKAKKYDWESAKLDDALAYLAEIRAECEVGGLILQKRVSELKIERVKCFGCENMINLSEGRWATMRTRNNFETGIPESAYACSAACGLKLNREFGHPTRVPQPVER